MASRIELKQTLLTKFTFFPDSRTIAGGTDMLSRIFEEELPRQNLFRITDSTLVSKGTATAILNHNPLVIEHERPYPEEDVNGNRGWFIDIRKIKPMPRSWTIFDPPIVIDVEE